MAMTCGDVELRLTEFSRHQLPRPEQRQVATHLRACLTCQAALFKNKRLSHLLKGWRPDARVPAWRQAACFLLLLLWLLAPFWGSNEVAPLDQETLAVLRQSVFLD